MTDNAPWLIIDSGSPRAMVGVASKEKVLAETFMDGHRKHAETLSQALTDCLDTASLSLDQICGVAVGRGPGSFVGVRVAMSTAKGLAFAKEKPLLGLCPLIALANEPNVPAGRGLSILDARKGELYFRLIDKKPGKLCTSEAEGTMAPHLLEKHYQGLDFVVGHGIDLFSENYLKNLRVLRLMGPTAEGYRHALLNAEPFSDELFSLAPHYWRAPDAKMPAPSPFAS